MSLEIKGESCPICHAYLFEEDEIAVCPTCGAPHHRECFVSAGKCGMEEFHGTNEQYDKVKKAAKEEKENKEKKDTDEQQNIMVECPSCHNRYSIKQSNCDKCGAQNIYGRAVMLGFDYYGGVKPKENLGEGHTAEEVRNFVAVGTDRTIPLFKKFKNGKKVSFSLWSFLFPAATFASRKMYPAAIFTAVLEIAAELFLMPLSAFIASTDVKSYVELYTAVLADNPKLLTLAYIGSFMYLTIKIVCSLISNRIYYKHTLKSLREIKTEPLTDEERFALYRKKGGLNLLAFVITFFAVNYLPQIIYALIA